MDDDMKRFTETDKWRDPWFRKLTPIAKLFFFWLVDHCDSAGVFDLDTEAATFDIGEGVMSHHFEELKSRVEKLPSGKFWIPKFIPFQYGSLSSKCAPHQRVIESLKSNSVKYPIDTLPTRVQSTLKEEEEEEDKEKKGGCGGRFKPPTIEEVRARALENGLPEFEADKFFNFYASKGWKVGKTPMVSWAHAFGGWKSRWESGGPRGSNGEPPPPKRNLDAWPIQPAFTLTRAPERKHFPDDGSFEAHMGLYETWKTKRLAEKAKGL